ncbi:MAG: methyltransferase domain-containing protein, partial [Candidatus Eremiobacteraeota bacterium]|nr:methyltransferase domain-containing protein [Candidatus Eremiobacteraeota bacterium]
MIVRALQLVFDPSSWHARRVLVRATADGEPEDRTIDATSRELSLPFADDTFSALECGDVLRYLPEPLAFMQELHRVSAPGATASFVLPDAGSDEAYSPIFATRPYTPVSFIYFGQPAYHRADYGYRGDWETVEAIYVVARERYAGGSIAAVKEALARERNQSLCFLMTLRAVKP